MVGSWLVSLHTLPKKTLGVPSQGRGWMSINVDWPYPMNTTTPSWIKMNQQFFNCFCKNKLPCKNQNIGISESKRCNCTSCVCFKIIFWRANFSNQRLMFKLKIQVTVQILITEGTEGLMFVVCPFEKTCQLSSDAMPPRTSCQVGHSFSIGKTWQKTVPETKISPHKVLLMESIRLTSWGWYFLPLFTGI